MPGIAMGNRIAIMEVIEKFLAASSKAEIFSLLTETMHAPGIRLPRLFALGRWAECGKSLPRRIEPLEGASLVDQDIFIDCPDSWLRRYQEAGHAVNDPVMKHVCKSTLPVFWDDASRAEPGNIVFGEARDHGLAHGVTVTVSVPGGQRALMSFSARQRPKETGTQRLMVAGLVQLSAQYVHEAVRIVENARHAETLPALTVRERDCLQWAAIGKTSWEMAQILKISERTVVFHLTNAASKLGAVNRRQAVVRALNLRLISP